MVGKRSEAEAEGARSVRTERGRPSNVNCRKGVESEDEEKGREGGKRSRLTMASIVWTVRP